MLEKLLPFVFLILFITPFLFIFIKKPKWFVINAIIVALYIINWIGVIGTIGYRGLFFFTWVGLLSLVIFFNYLILSILFLKIVPTINKYILPIMFITAVSIGCYHYGIEKVSPSTLFDVLILNITPIFYLLYVVIALLQLVMLWLIKSYKR